MNRIRGIKNYPLEGSDFQVNVSMTMILMLDSPYGKLYTAYLGTVSVHQHPSQFRKELPVLPSNQSKLRVCQNFESVARYRSKLLEIPVLTRSLKFSDIELRLETD